jgi:hypothetical protein
MLEHLMTLQIFNQQSQLKSQVNQLEIDLTLMSILEQIHLTLPILLQLQDQIRETLLQEDRLKEDKVEIKCLLMELNWFSIPQFSEVKEIPLKEANLKLKRNLREIMEELLSKGLSNKVINSKDLKMETLNTNSRQVDFHKTLSSREDLKATTSLNIRVLTTSSLVLLTMKLCQLTLFMTRFPLTTLMHSWQTLITLKDSNPLMTQIS